MNVKIVIHCLLGATCNFAQGALIGVGVAFLTLWSIKRLAKRAERYAPTYVPVVLVETKCHSFFFAFYPVVFGVCFALVRIWDCIPNTK